MIRRYKHCIWTLIRNDVEIAFGRKNLFPHWLTPEKIHTYFLNNQPKECIHVGDVLKVISTSGVPICEVKY